MIYGPGWINQCLSKLPPRQSILRLDESYINFDPVTRRGTVKIAVVPAHPDTIICYNLFDNINTSRAVIPQLYDMLADDGVMIIVCPVIHPGAMRRILTIFAWKYITVVPDAGELYAVAGKGYRPDGIKMALGV